MKKVFLMTAIAVMAAFTITSCGSHAGKGNATEQTQAMKTVYTCEMHPEVIMDKPGKCPKCGMELVKKEVPATDSIQKHPADSMKSMKM